MKHFTQAQAETALRMFWHEGKKLGEIAKALDCGLYDLSPWIYSRQAEREAAELVRRPDQGGEVR